MAVKLEVTAQHRHITQKKNPHLQYWDKILTKDR